MAPILLSPKNRNPHPDELKSMIAAVLNLLEDQHILHGTSVAFVSSPNCRLQSTHVLREYSFCLPLRKQKSRSSSLTSCTLNHLRRLLRTQGGPTTLRASSSTCSTAYDRNAFDFRSSLLSSCPSICYCVVFACKLILSNVKSLAA